MISRVKIRSSKVGDVVQFLYSLFSVCLGPSVVNTATQGWGREGEVGHRA